MNKFNKYIQIIAIFFTIIIILNLFLEILNSSSKNNFFKDETFNLSINGQNYGEIDIANTYLPSVKEGDNIHITKKLDASIYGEKTLVFRTYNTTVDVMLSDSNIYTYGNDLYKKSAILGRGFHMVKLNSIDETNPSLSIDLKAGEDMSYMWIDFLSQQQAIISGWIYTMKI